jgi:hypothetical protein
MTTYQKTKVIVNDYLNHNGLRSPIDLQDFDDYIEFYNEDDKEMLVSLSNSFFDEMRFKKEIIFIPDLNNNEKCFIRTTDFSANDLASISAMNYLGSLMLLTMHLTGFDKNREIKIGNIVISIDANRRAITIKYGDLIFTNGIKILLVSNFKIVEPVVEHIINILEDYNEKKNKP